MKNASELQDSTRRVHGLSTRLIRRTQLKCTGGMGWYEAKIVPRRPLEGFLGVLLLVVSKATW
jgi:hypothetical protein